MYILKKAELDLPIYYLFPMIYYKQLYISINLFFYFLFWYYYRLSEVTKILQSGLQLAFPNGTISPNYSTLS